MNPLFMVLTTLLLLCSTGAQAQTRFLNDRVTLSGFGTLGLVHNNQSEAAPIRHTGQPHGAEHGLSGRIDTRLGLQGRLRLNDEVDTVAQVMSQYHDTGNFRPELMLAFIRYTPDPAFQLRIGRLGWDVDLISDSRHVGYAYPWIRPPVDHFGVLQLTWIDGVDVTFKQPVGSDLVWARFFAGSSDSRFFMSDDLSAHFDVHRVYGGHLNYETGDWRFRAGYTQVNSGVTFDGTLADQVEQFFNVDANHYFNYLIGFDQLEIYSLGAVYNPGPLQFQAIWNRDVLAGGDTWIDSGFLSAAWRLDTLTPYALLSGVRTHDAREDPIGSNVEQNTWSLGLRYDMATNLALKAQVDRIHTLSPGLLWRDVDDDWNGGWSTLVSLGLDFVF